MTNDGKNMNFFVLTISDFFSLAMDAVGGNFRAKTGGLFRAIIRGFGALAQSVRAMES
jgi:hypothetical protein